MLRIKPTKRFFAVLGVVLIACAVRADDKITYQDNVLPLIQAHCAKCHNEDKR